MAKLWPRSGKGMISWSWPASSMTVASNLPAFLRAARYKGASRAASATADGISEAPAPQAFKGAASPAPPYAAIMVRKRRRSISVERIKAQPYAERRRHMLIHDAFGVFQQQRSEGKLPIAVLVLRQLLHGLPQTFEVIHAALKLAAKVLIYPGFIILVDIATRLIELQHAFNARSHRVGRQAATPERRARRFRLLEALAQYWHQLDVVGELQACGQGLDGLGGYLLRTAIKGTVRSGVGKLFAVRAFFAPGLDQFGTDRCEVARDCGGIGAGAIKVRWQCRGRLVGRTLCPDGQYAVLSVQDILQRRQALHGHTVGG